MVAPAFTPQAVAERARHFHAAPLVTLRPDSGALFELYLALPGPGGLRFMLYKASGLEFTDKKRKELIENGVSTLYVQGDDAGEYYEYVDRTVGQLLASEKVPPKEKTRVLYETTQSIVKSTYDQPGSPLLLSANRSMVTHTVTTITSEPAMLRTMVEMFAMDYSLYTHAVHVSVLGTALAIETGSFVPTQIHELALGYLLHDIGKSRVPADILKKPGTLTTHELRQMQKHPELGAGLMQLHTSITPSAVNVIRDHHERMNGRGYPRHLDARFISLETRICSVADVYDALTSTRVYKPAMSGYEALKMILAKMPDELDDDILHLLIHRLGPNAHRLV
jgi:HD-GYP domain-containing protein (c-di-GMP phosphodiesterase class II)